MENLITIICLIIFSFLYIISVELRLSYFKNELLSCQDEIRNKTSDIINQLQKNRAVQLSSYQVEKILRLVENEYTLMKTYDYFRFINQEKVASLSKENEDLKSKMKLP